MERLCDVRGRVFHDYRAMLSHFRSAVILALSQHILRQSLCVFLLIQEHVHIGIYRLNLFKNAGTFDSCSHILCNQRRCFAQCFRQTEARERVVSHLCVSRNFNPLQDFLRCHIQRFVFCNNFSNFLFVIDHLLFSVLSNYIFRSRGNPVFPKQSDKNTIPRD